MKTAKSSAPIEAVQKIYAALEPLGEDDRRRALVSVMSLMSIDVGPISPTVGEVSAGTGRVEIAALGAGGRPLSLVELLGEKQPTTNAQRIAVFAYYREKVEALARFSRADLRAYFARAKQPPPGNYDRDFSTAAALGWIHEDGSESYLTTKGLEAIEAGFGGKQPPRGRRASRPRAAKKGARRTPSKKRVRR